MSSIDHIVLFFFLFMLFIFWGKYKYNIKSNADFWVVALLPIIAYSMIVGCRYNWGTDYRWYRYQFENPTNSDVVFNTQSGWRYFNQILADIGLNYVGAFISYSLIYIVCAFALMRSYGKESKYMYAFFLPATLLLTTFTIRQSVAFSFIFLAIYFANKKDWIKTSIAIILSALVHSSSIISVVWISSFFLFVKRPISWKVAIPLYLFFAFAWDISQIGFISNYIKMINLGGSHFQGYIENSDRWFSDEAVEDKYLQSALTLTLSSLFHISMIFFCFNCLKSDRSCRSVINLYNVIVVGLIVNRAGFSLELVRRMGDTIFSLYFIPLGYCWHQFYSKNKIELKGKNRYIMNLCVFIMVFYSITYYGRWLMFFDDLFSSLPLPVKSTFIWNQ